MKYHYSLTRNTDYLLIAGIGLFLIGGLLALLIAIFKKDEYSLAMRVFYLTPKCIIAVLILGYTVRMAESIKWLLLAETIRI